ncbi:hypothetical protein DFQ14_11626 [Halopolyspora algeriensis]|uniref:Uncharacterized protein n=1 Tax=Halopolyspora algeriensis TaxID=1500506 RepID=A0A368VKM1_9ACTN|nr:hypothetical protein DFQ14_11626 [Halopolyspora algeriensis]TQM56146.1 hypothetical protein FHU43_0937 [Halopolyspora algeriensis]
MATRLTAHMRSATSWTVGYVLAVSPRQSIVTIGHQRGVETEQRAGRQDTAGPARTPAAHTILDRS